VFKNRVLRGTFEPKWRKLHNKELQSLYSLSHYLGYIIKDEMGGACTHIGHMKCIKKFGQKM
jgi:hypothetical protein